MKLSFDVNHCVRFFNPFESDVLAELEELNSTVSELKEFFMATVQDLQQEVAETAAAVNSLIGVINVQSQSLADLGVRLEQAIAAQDAAGIAAVKAGLDALQEQAAAVVAANTPAAPVTPADPV